MTNELKFILEHPKYLLALFVLIKVYCIFDFIIAADRWFHRSGKKITRLLPALIPKGY